MTSLLWLVPALPLAGFLVLALVGGRVPRKLAATVGVGTVTGSFAVTLALLTGFDGVPVTQTVWTWLDVAGLDPSIGFRLDALALVMCLVVTGVGALIHLYSAEHMAHQDGAGDGYGRFFAYLNLFVAMMLVLVLADDLVLLLLGWEGVGLCSYLLIGFWYRDPANGRAARKAFVVTRVGDVALMLGIFFLFTRLGTVDLQLVMERAAEAWSVGGTPAVLASALLLGGAVGKSAQLPLQTWLPDAMAGPTPVSALIHAATMVTAGVYLVARTHRLFELAPPVLLAVAVVGAATLLLAACSALVQRDIKRVLAYSTISQIGYMFLALGVGAWSAAIFHLVTHAFFKALLFLGAGAVILALHHEHDIFEMGGLRREMPLTFWTFLAGAAALAGLPLVTAGFYSKDLILAQAFHHGGAGLGLWGIGLAGAFLTALYSFRLVFVPFFGELRLRPERRPGAAVALPLVVLAALSIVGGFVETPATLGGVSTFSHFLEPTLPATEHHGEVGTELLLQGAAATASLAGLALAWVWYGRRRERRTADATPLVPSPLHRLWFSGWGFDRLYSTLFVRPFVGLARLNRDDVVDLLPQGIAAATREGHRLVRRTQTGSLRWYAASLGLGAVVLLGLMILL